MFVMDHGERMDAPKRQAAGKSSPQVTVTQKQLQDQAALQSLDVWRIRLFFSVSFCCVSFVLIQLKLLC